MLMEGSTPKGVARFGRASPAGLPLLRAQSVDSPEPRFVLLVDRAVAAGCQRPGPSSLWETFKSSIFFLGVDSWSILVNHRSFQKPADALSILFNHGSFQKPDLFPPGFWVVFYPEGCLERMEMEGTPRLLVSCIVTM